MKIVRNKETTYTMYFKLTGGACCCPVPYQSPRRRCLQSSGWLLLVTRPDSPPAPPAPPLPHPAPFALEYFQAAPRSPPWWFPRQWESCPAGCLKSSVSRSCPRNTDRYAQEFSNVRVCIYKWESGWPHKLSIKGILAVQNLYGPKDGKNVSTTRITPITITTTKAPTTTKTVTRVTPDNSFDTDLCTLRHLDAALILNRRTSRADAPYGRLAWTIEFTVNRLYSITWDFFRPISRVCHPCIKDPLEI